MRKMVMLALALSTYAGAASGLSSKSMEEFGGLVTKPAVGFVAVVDCKSGFDTAQVGDFFFPRGKCMRIPYRVFRESAAFNAVTAEARLKSLGANAAIFIGDDPTLPMSLTAVEAKWTFINYGCLIADNPGGELVNRRMDKMFSRATMAILGGGSFMNFPMSATKRVNSIADLDRLEGRSPSPFAMMSMSAYIDELGIKFEQESTYEQACQEGWAPAPTNEIQKAIWREIHTPPTKPLKITYDKDRQKPIVN